MTGEAKKLELSFIPGQECELVLDGRTYPDVWYNRDADPDGIDFLTLRWDSEAHPRVDADQEDDAVYVRYGSIVISLDPDLAREIGRATEQFEWLGV